MADLGKELAAWFKKRPAWLQDATRRLLEKGELDDAEREFPFIGDGGVCVLCQQPLDEIAKKRLADFEGLVKGELGLSAKASR